MEWAIWPVELEVRGSNRRGRKLRGSFPYRQPATISDRGTVRKERFEPGAFGYQLNRFVSLNDKLGKLANEAIQSEIGEEIRRQLASLNVDLLRGHSFDKPLASMVRGSLKITDADDALRFEASIPTNPPSWIVDTMKSIDAGLIRGVSPGFRVPPKSVVPGAERFIPEPGNPGVQIREIRQAVLYELSLVTRPAYVGSEVALREDDPLLSLFPTEPDPDPKPAPDDSRYFRWL